MVPVDFMGVCEKAIENGASPQDIVAIMGMTPVNMFYFLVSESDIKSQDEVLELMFVCMRRQFADLQSKSTETKQ